MDLGTTIELSDQFDLKLKKEIHGMELVSGYDNLTQSIKVLLNTFKNENVFYPTYGFDINSLTSQGHTDSFISYLIKKTLLQHPYVKEVGNITIDKTANHEMNITAVLQGVDGISITIGGDIKW